VVVDPLLVLCTVIGLSVEDLSEAGGQHGPEQRHLRHQREDVALELSDDEGTLREVQPGGAGRERPGLLAQLQVDPGPELAIRHLRVARQLRAPARRVVPPEVVDDPGGALLAFECDFWIASEEAQSEGDSAGSGLLGSTPPTGVVNVDTACTSGVGPSTKLVVTAG